jgi:hypothetical protein
MKEKTDIMDRILNRIFVTALFVSCVFSWTLTLG